MLRSATRAAAALISPSEPSRGPRNLSVVVDLIRDTPPPRSGAEIPDDDDMEERIAVAGYDDMEERIVVAGYGRRVEGAEDAEEEGLQEEEIRILPPARESFTRSPREGDHLVCPSCDHELGTPSKEHKDHDRMWVGTCGHMYCGKCAEVKIAGGSCDVEECMVSLRGAAIWQVYAP